MVVSVKVVSVGAVVADRLGADDATFRGRVAALNAKRDVIREVNRHSAVVVVEARGAHRHVAVVTESKGSVLTEVAPGAVR